VTKKTPALAEAACFEERNRLLFVRDVIKRLQDINGIKVVSPLLSCP
jgi:hypothetical protein